MSVKNRAKEADALNPPAEDTDVMEEILRSLGGLGTYQRLLCLMMLPIGIIFAFTYSSQMFVTATPHQYWCLVPELAHLDVQLRRNLSIPGASKGEDWDRCTVLDANWTQVLANLTPPDPGTPVKPCQHGWEFLYDDIKYSTVVSEREWVCDRASLGPYAQMLFFVGSLIGCGLFGWMGDKYGRVPALMGSNLIGCIGGVASVFTVGFWDFALCRFLVGLSNDFMFVMLYILVLEYVDSRYRSWVGNLSFAIALGGGGMIMPVLAYWLRNWQHLLLVTSLPMLIVLAAPWAVPESAQVLKCYLNKMVKFKGKNEKSVRILKRFERINGKKIPEELINKFVTSGAATTVSDESMSAVLRSATLRNSLIIVTLVTMGSNIIIDAIIRLSETIGTNFFVTFALSSAAEIPAMTLVALVLDRAGRRFLTCLTVSLAGGLSIVCAFMPQGILQLVLAIMIRFAINMSVGIQFQLAAEILPTGQRATGSSIIHITVYLATAVSPLIVYSGRIWSGLPLVILGGIGLAGGGGALLLPETKGQPMPQTIADAETLIRENSLCRKPEKEVEGAEVIFLENKNAVDFG